MKKVLLSVLIFAGILCVNTPAHAIILNAVDSGWYRDTGYHDSSNTNYIVGKDSNSIYRNWFVFDLTSFSDLIISATLRLDTADVSATGDYSIFDVSTGISALRAGGTGLTSIYDDLGTGSSYGLGTIPDSHDNVNKDFALNSTAIADLSNASGLFALGGSYSTTCGYAFGASSVGTRQLILETDPKNVVPEPTTMILFGIGMAGAFVRKRFSA